MIMIVKSISAVLFDLDGVLVDACDWHYESLNRALEEEGFRPIRREEHLSTYNGLPTRVKLDMLGIIGERASRVEARKQSHTMLVIAERAVPMREKLELHAHLKMLGLKTACVTNSIRMTAEEMLRRTGQIGMMDIIVANEDVAHNKPSPDPYLHAMQALGFPPEKCICVEDSPKGVESALASGGRLWRVGGTEDVNLGEWTRYVAREGFN